MLLSFRQVLYYSLFKASNRASKSASASLTPAAWATGCLAAGADNELEAGFSPKFTNKIENFYNRLKKIALNYRSEITGEVFLLSLPEKQK